MKAKRLLIAVCLLLVSASMLGTASFAWFSMNTEVGVDGIEFEAYSDALFLEIAPEDVEDKYDVTTTLTEGKKALRLVTPIATPVSDVTVYNLSATALSGKYDSATYASTVIYALGDEKNDSLSELNYVVVDKAATFVEASDLTGYFTATFVRTAHDAVAVGGTVYYEKVMNGYKVVDVTVGESVYGYYTATVTDASGSYTGGDYFEFIDTDSNSAADTYALVTDLTLGSDLTGYFTLTETQIGDLTAAEGDVYVKDAADNYVCICQLSAAEDITDMFVWGRTYSDTLGDPQVNNVLSAIKKGELGSYYHHDTVYLRNAENTNDGRELKIADVKIGGRVNALTSAVRILFVATNGKGETVYTTYSNAAGEGMATFNGDLFDTILGNRGEVVKVDMYFYFDGTDASAFTVEGSEAGLLNGQSVEIKFTIAENTYD